jgi:hypothetical protein
VRVTCPCGSSRHIEPEALARLVGRKVTLAALATRMRCSQCGKKVAEVVAVARPSREGAVGAYGGGAPDGPVPNTGHPTSKKPTLGLSPVLPLPAEDLKFRTSDPTTLSSRHRGGEKTSGPRGGPAVAEASHAVFLSYASQDAEAAQKIAETLGAGAP